MLDGAIHLRAVRTVPRALGREVAVESGTLLVRPSAGPKGSLEIMVADDAPLAGRIEDGAVRIRGGVKLPTVQARRTAGDWLPDRGIVRVEGENLEWNQPGEYSVVVNPNVAFRFVGLQTRERPALGLSGAVDILEGRYEKGFNVLASTIGNVLGGRRVGTYSQPITERFPALADLALDLRVSGRNFRVQSDFGVGSTDIEAGLNLRASGTFGQPRLHGLVQVTDGTITYQVVRREFEVTVGRITFDGDPARPILDVEAQTNIESPQTIGGRTERIDYLITVRVKGRVPDYTISLESRPSLAQIDIQYLILTGQTKTALEQGGVRSPATLDLLKANVADIITGIISAPFVKEVNVKPVTGGNLQVDLVLELGRRIRVDVTARPGADTGTEYDLRYYHPITDRLGFEAIRRGRDTSRDRTRYEVRFKYTVPLE